MGIHLEPPSVNCEGKNGTPSVDVSMVDGSDEAIDRGSRSTKNTPNKAGRENTGQVINIEGPDFRNREHEGDGINLNSSKTEDPRHGMEFQSKEEAFSFYKEYAKSVGFSVLIKASRRSRISAKFIDAKFACTRYGNKREPSTVEATEPIANVENAVVNPAKKKRGRTNHSWEKTDCKASMHVKQLQDGRWTIHSFIKEHNHEMLPNQAHYFSGRWSLDLGCKNVDTLHPIRARTKKIYPAISTQSGGSKKAEKRKSTSTVQFCSAQNLSIEEGDAKVMLSFFVDMHNENPNFFYAVDFNEDQQLRNVFWADAKGRLDYRSFGDVVFFDMNYINNEYKLPFAPFIGVNHHSQYLLLGCALVADQSKSTYIWLLRAWLRAMRRQPPKLILTDQDEALKEAVTEVFPNSHHCFCLWHVFSKIQERLSYVIRQHENFMKKFNKCIFRSWTAEQLEYRWLKIVDRFNIKNDRWFQSLYEDREHWVPAFMRNIFLAGMSTTQRSESMSCFLDKYIQRRTTLNEFIEQYKTILQDRYEEEAKADSEIWHKQPGLKSPSPFGKQMAKLYTRAIFKKFQVEVLGVVACHPKKESEYGGTMTFRVQDFEKNQDFIVEWNEKTSDISCLCWSFEFNGYLCRHVMIVLQMYGIHSIPSQYVLTRWTKEAKSRLQMRQQTDTVPRVQRYNDLCQQAFELSDVGSLTWGSYNIVFNALEEASRKCEGLYNSIQCVSEPSSPSMQCSLGEVNQSNSSAKSNENRATSRRRQGQTNSEATGLDCSYQSQGGMRGMEQNSRAPTVESYFGEQQLLQGMVQISSIPPCCDDYFGNQHTIQGLGQLNLRPQAISSCFDIQEGLQLMDQTNLGSVQLHGSSSNLLKPKNPSHRQP